MSDDINYEQEFPGIKKLDQEKAYTKSPSTQITSNPSKIEAIASEEASSVPDIPIKAMHNEHIDPEAILAYFQIGLQAKMRKQLKQGNIQIQDRCDLHGYSLDEAQHITHHFLENAFNNHHRSLLLITGKGAHSNDMTIKSMMHQWLRSHPLVLAYHTAQPKDGGTGALYIILKKG